jgi:D-glycero-alpha-D-manno-heptose 1-phosphate guanylyltransferase
MKITTCIVLAGGLGTRLKSVLVDKPKCLAPIGNRFFLEIQLESLKSRGVNKFLLALGHQFYHVVDVLKDLERRFDIEFVIENSPLGTGGAILNAMNYFHLDEVLVVNGDTYLDGDISEMLPPLDLSGDPNELARLAVIKVSDVSRYGEVDMKGNIIFDFMEKNQAGPGFINAGFYHLHKRTLEPYSLGEPFSFEKDILPRLVKKRCLQGVLISGMFVDIGIPSDYFNFCTYFKHNQ